MNYPACQDTQLPARKDSESQHPSISIKWAKTPSHSLEKLLRWLILVINLII